MPVRYLQYTAVMQWTEEVFSPKYLAFLLFADMSLLSCIELGIMMPDGGDRVVIRNPGVFYEKMVFIDYRPPPCT
jgi:hypothetical protein